MVRLDWSLRTRAPEDCTMTVPTMLTVELRLRVAREGIEIFALIFAGPEKVTEPNGERSECLQLNET